MKPFLIQIIKNIYYIINFIKTFFLKKIKKNITCKIQNIFLFYKPNIKFFFNNDLNLFIIKEGPLFRYFNSMERGFSLYSKGIKARGYSLAKEYCLENIKFTKDDCVIDVGANYGDLFIYLSDKIKQSNYIAFEPSPAEFKCLEKNIPGAQLHEIALSNVNDEMNFYINSHQADSSLIINGDYTEIKKVKVRTLDRILTKLEKCKLLKIEAEGLESNIILVAKNFIKRCNYIAVDGGYERSHLHLKTLHTVNNFLLKNNFEMVDINGKRLVGLFKNQDYDEISLNKLLKSDTST